MSRSGRDDARSDGAPRPIERPLAARRPAVPTLPAHALAERLGPHREPVAYHDRTYHLRASDVRLLTTVGVFRVVRADDLQRMRSSRDAWAGDVRHLRDQGLVEAKTVTINRDPIAVVVLTHEGKSLLEVHQDRSKDVPHQAFHAGLVKPRELAHDAQLYRLFQAEATRIEADGGRVLRVLLDYELKRDYQRFLNRADAPNDHPGEDDLVRFASDYQLPVVDGHLELPDIRIEYEGPDGQALHRDVELVTEHYSRSQLAGKARAGFALYRAAGSAGGRGGSARTGGTPFDPHHLEWLVG